MIAVIADDFTGAAELGAIGLRYALKTEVQTQFDPTSDADLIVIDTDTRCCSPSEAQEKVERLISQVCLRHPELLFKKVDSVLRGPVLAELAAVLNATGAHRLLLVPANPSLGRVVRNGRYYINDCPVHLTEFDRDPDHPIRSSDVLEMLGTEATAYVSVQPPGALRTDSRIVLGEAASKDDVISWASRLESTTVPAGASEFFQRILESRNIRGTEEPTFCNSEKATTTLFVCGSASSSSQARIAFAEINGTTVARMPSELLDQDGNSTHLISCWAEEARTALLTAGKAILTIGLLESKKSGLPDLLKHFLANAAQAVITTTPIDCLCVEGGATASTLARQMGWNRLSVCAETAPGVVIMRVIGSDSPVIVTKPGSYSWNETM